MLEILRDCYRAFRPDYRLFEGADECKRSASSVQKTCRRDKQASGITPWSTPHTLRHSFASHVLESGENLRNIQTQLGYCSSKKSERYPHIVDINNKRPMSPLDIMMKRIAFGEIDTMKDKNDSYTNRK